MVPSAQAPATYIISMPGATVSSVGPTRHGRRQRSPSVHAHSPSRNRRKASQKSRTTPHECVEAFHHRDSPACSVAMDAHSAASRPKGFCQSTRPCGPDSRQVSFVERQGWTPGKLQPQGVLRQVRTRDESYLGQGMFVRALLTRIISSMRARTRPSGLESLTAWKSYEATCCCKMA